jgi:predicted AlkP superfamily pyrophosphatase or phosphodiesterase
MDYFILESQDAVNAKTAELILSDKYDFYVVYNVSYDTQMHRTGPESLEALAELRVNSRAFRTFTKMIEEHWTGHNTLVGFAMDHGCHEIDGGCGSHGLDMEEDINIVHLYKGYKRLHR